MLFSHIVRAKDQQVPHTESCQLDLLGVDGNGVFGDNSVCPEALSRCLSHV